MGGDRVKFSSRMNLPQCVGCVGTGDMSGERDSFSRVDMGLPQCAFEEDFHFVITNSSGL